MVQATTGRGQDGRAGAIYDYWRHSGTWRAGATRHGRSNHADYVDTNELGPASELAACRSRVSAGARGQ